jgi:hypothetical protein
MAILSEDISVLLLTNEITSFIKYSTFCLKYSYKFILQIYYNYRIYFQTYKIPMHLLVKTTVKMILVAVTMIFWVSMMNKLYYGC